MLEDVSRETPELQACLARLNSLDMRPFVEMLRKELTACIDDLIISNDIHMIAKKQERVVFIRELLTAIEGPEAGLN